jgi:nicotinamidase-related amidase
MLANDPLTALLLIDIQQGFTHPKWGQRNNPDAEQKMAAILAAWRQARRPLFHVKHDSTDLSSPLALGQAGNEIMKIVYPAPGEVVLRKSVNSAFIGTSLQDSLMKKGITGVVIVGLTTPHCVSTTARMAGNLGFKVRVVADATAAFELRGLDGQKVSPEEAHYHALTALSGEFAEIVSTDALLASAQN